MNISDRYNELVAGIEERRITQLLKKKTCEVKIKIDFNEGQRIRRSCWGISRNLRREWETMTKQDK